MTNQHRRAALLMGAAAVLWGLSGPLIKLAAWDETGIAFARVAATALLLGAVLLTCGRWRVPPGKSAFLAMLLIGTTNLCWGLAASRISVALALLLFYLNIPLAALFEHCAMRRWPSRWTIVWAVVAFMGLAVSLPWHDTRASALGILFSLGSAVAWGCASHRATRFTPNEAMTAIVVGDLLVLPLCVPFVLAWPQPTAGEMGWIAAVGVVSTVPFVLWAASVQRLSAVEANLILMLEVAVGFVAVWIWLADPPTWQQIVGGSLIIAAGVAIITRKEGKQ